MMPSGHREPDGSQPGAQALAARGYCKLHERSRSIAETMPECAIPHAFPARGPFFAPLPARRMQALASNSPTWIAFSYLSPSMVTR
jgi:hypothetical protein